jgi:hypothetical protein
MQNESATQIVGSENALLPQQWRRIFNVEAQIMVPLQNKTTLPYYLFPRIYKLNRRLKLYTK